MLKLYTHTTDTIKNTQKKGRSHSSVKLFTGCVLAPIDQDQVLTTWSGGCQNGLILNLRLCDVRALLASKLDINIQ